MRLKNALLIISATSSLIATTACSPLEKFHQKSLQVVADLKGVELPAQQAKVSDLTFTLDLSSSYERYVSKDLLEVSAKILQEFDRKYNNKEFFTEVELMSLRSLLEPYSYLEEDDFDSQFNDESADYNDKSLYEYLNQCFYYLEKQYYSEYIEYLAHVKQLIGQPMTFEHNLNSLEHEVVIDFAMMRGSITDPQNVLDEKLNEIKDKYQFKLISTKTSNKNPTLIKVTYEYIDSVGNPPIRKTEVYSIAVLDKGNWSFSYILHPDED